MTTILIVDDSKLSRVMSRRTLIRAGYETLEAESAREGLELLQEKQPDCVTLDLLMPDMDGLQFLSAMSELGLHTPVIVLTANIQQDAREECLQKGAADVINKPGGKGETLVESVARVLKASGKEQP